MIGGDEVIVKGTQYEELTGQNTYLHRIYHCVPLIMVSAISRVLVSGTQFPGERVGEAAQQP